jgi:hypothetical protein
MSRSKPVSVAAILQFAFSVFAVVSTLPNLARGSTPEGGEVFGFVVTLVSFTAGVLGLVGAYGAWRNTKNGKILSIVMNVVFVLLFLGGVLFASPGVKIIAGALLLVPLLGIFLMLYRSANTAAA